MSTAHVIVSDTELSPMPLHGRLLAAWLGQRLSCGRLDLALPDGSATRIDSGLPGPTAEIVIRRWRALARFRIGGIAGFTAAYLDGDWDSPDLPSAIELGARHVSAFRPGKLLTLPARLANRLRHLRNANTRRGSRRNVARHYDLGNAFYALWLDPSMTYSSAIFAADGQSLHEAQNNKCRRLLDLLAPRPGERLLEIGCGWGHFAILAAKERGLRVTALTLSRSQHELAARRVHEEGIGDRVSVMLTDYRDIGGAYDHVAAVEMIEAVGERYWPPFFSGIHDVLRPGGRAAIQAITIDDGLFDRYRRSADFIQRHVFPGGMLPSRCAIARVASRAGLKITSDEGFGDHYTRTLAAWRNRFQAAWPQIRAQGFNERFGRLWIAYNFK